MSSGNCVADYRVVRVTCGECCGTGLIVSHDDLREYLNGSGLSFSSRRFVVKRWKRDGFLTCEECGGRGTVERRR